MKLNCVTRLDQQLLAIEGSQKLNWELGLNVQLDGVRKAPWNPAALPPYAEVVLDLQLGSHAQAPTQTLHTNQQLHNENERDKQQWSPIITPSVLNLEGFEKWDTAMNSAAAEPPPDVKRPSSTAHSNSIATPTPVTTARGSKVNTAYDPESYSLLHRSPRFCFWLWSAAMLVFSSVVPILFPLLPLHPVFWMNEALE